MQATLIYRPGVGESRRLFLPIEFEQTLPSGVAIEGRMMAILEGTHQIAVNFAEHILSVTDKYPALAALLDSGQLDILIPDNFDMNFADATDSDRNLLIQQCSDVEILRSWQTVPDLKSWRKGQITRRINKLLGGG